MLQNPILMWMVTVMRIFPIPIRKEENPGNYMGANPTDLPNIMYANNTSGSFVKAVAFDGYDTGWDKYSFNKGSRIAVDAAGTTYYIIAHKYGYIPSEGDRYYIAIKAPLSNTWKLFRCIR